MIVSATPYKSSLAVLNSDGGKGCGLKGLIPDTRHRGRNGNACDGRTIVESQIRHGSHIIGHALVGDAGRNDHITRDTVGLAHRHRFCISIRHREAKIVHDERLRHSSLPCQQQGNDCKE